MTRRFVCENQRISYRGVFEARPNARDRLVLLRLTVYGRSAGSATLTELNLRLAQYPTPPEIVPECGRRVRLRIREIAPTRGRGEVYEIGPR